MNRLRQKDKFKSISFKIWRILSMALIFFFTAIIVLSLNIIAHVKNQAIFQQLEFASKNTIMRPPELDMAPDARTPWVSEFRVGRKTKDSEIFMIIPREAPRRHPRDKRFVSMEIMLEKIIETDAKPEKKILKIGDTLAFYRIFWIEETLGGDKREEARVIFTVIPQNSDLELGLFLGMLALLAVSFLVSKILAQKIAEPIVKLEKFSDEIAKRNWKVKVPDMDNDEIGMLSKALENMRDSLKIAEERDRQFLQSTSHDLKTPVMIIKGYAQSMIDGIKINSDKTEAEIIKIEAEKLERRIVQLLKLNTISHSLEYSENREIVRVDRILNNLISRFQVLKSDLNWDNELKEFEMLGDSEALFIAFENIIENQMRYAKSLISISMDIKKENPDIANITISNNGPKFEVEDTSSLFNMYKKDRQGKFGLGLSIVRQVIEAHSGEVTASNTDRGVEFKVVLHK